MNINQEPEKLLISFSDILSILRKAAVKILYFAIAFGILGALWAVTRPIRYQAEGTFRERGIKQAAFSPSSSLVQLFGMSGLSGTESEAASLMLSRVILKDVIEKFHLQADLQAHNDGETLIKLIKRNLILSWAGIKKNSHPVLEEICCPLKFESFKYPGEISLALTLILAEDGTYQVFDTYASKNKIGEGTLGTPFVYQDLSFNLIPQDEKPGASLIPQSYSLTIHSLQDTAKELIKSLGVESSKLDKNLLEISFDHRNRNMASRIVNAIMASYQDYSKKYHSLMAMKQLDYLGERRIQLTQNLTDAMHKHADFLANDLYSSGFIESDKEMDFLAKSQHEYKQRLLDNELEIKRLANIKPDNFAHYDRFSVNDGDPAIINNIFSEMRSLKQQRDGLEIEIQKKAAGREENIQQFFEQQLNELKQVQEYLAELKEMNSRFQQGALPDPHSKLFNDPRFLLKIWFDRLQKGDGGKQKNGSDTLENLQFYLNNLERLFGVHERILQERLTHQQNPSGEYQGISLEVATDLYRDYSKELIQIESNIRQNIFFIEQIKDPEFEITSLSAGLNDSISNGIITKAGELVLNLRDENNQSVREQARIKEELDLQRTFLTMHLHQMVHLMELNKQLLNEKIYSLQNVSLELTHQRISLLEKNLEDYLQSRMQNLQHERALIKRHLENIHLEMAQLPQKWVSEQLLKQEVEANQLIVQEIVKLVETKNISHNLEVLQSAPVDAALSPLHPIPPKVFLWSFLGFFAGGCLGACFALAQSLAKGLKISPQHLEEMGGHVSGSLASPLSLNSEPLQGKNLETLRRLQLFFDQEEHRNQPILLIEGHGPDYAPFLADLLIKKGRRVLTLYLDGDFAKSTSQGLMNFLKGELPSLPIQKGEHGDWVAAGEESIFGCEMLSSPNFKKLMDELQTKYDAILAVSRFSPTSIEAECLVSQFSNVAISLSEETVEELNFYFDFLKSHSQNKVTFILT